MRTTEAIYQEMLGAYAARRGGQLQEDCELAVRLWAAAAQIQALEAQAEWVLGQSFPQTATGVYLDYHAAVRNMTRQAAGRARGTGTVDVYVTTPGGAPSEELLAELQAVFQKNREIAVDVQVKAPEEVAVNVSVSLETAENADFETVKADTESMLAEFFGGKLLGKGVTLAELGSRIYAIPGVKNYHLTAPAADVAPNDTVLPVLGTVSVTEEA